MKVESCYRFSSYWAAFDFNGDHISELALFEHSLGQWVIKAIGLGYDLNDCEFYLYN